MRHLSRADYRAMPWANGRGTTLELARADGPGGIEWRLSIAAVVEDGAFSLFPGVDRVLTVLDGPGFRLVGSGLDLSALPLVPVAFPGDVALAAQDVATACTDFNLMVARRLYRAEVVVASGEFVAAAPAFVLALEAGPVQVNGERQQMQVHDLVLLEKAETFHGPARHIRATLFPRD